MEAETDLWRQTQKVSPPYYMDIRKPLQVPELWQDPVGSGVRQAGLGSNVQGGLEEKGRGPGGRKMPRQVYAHIRVVMSSAADTGGTRVRLFLEVGPSVLQIAVS